MSKSYFDLQSLALDDLSSRGGLNNILTDELHVMMGRIHRGIDIKTYDSIRKKYSELRPNTSAELLAIPLVKIVFDSLNSFYQKLFTTYLALAPTLGNVKIEIGSTRGYRQANIFQDVSSFFYILAGFSTFQFIEFEAIKHWDGEEFWGYNSSGFLGIYYTALLSLSEGDAIFEKIKKAIYNSENVTSISHEVIRGMLQSNRQEAHHITMDLLKSAKLSEGLRDSVLSYIDLGQIETYKYFLQYIKEEKLIRFTSVKSAFLKYTCLASESVSDKSHNLISEYIFDCLLDGKTMEYIDSEHALKFYIGLYSMGCENFNLAEKFIFDNYHDLPNYKKTVCLAFLNCCNIPINSKLLTSFLGDIESNNLFALVNSFYSPKIVFDDNDEKKKFIVAYCKQLELQAKKDQSYTVFDGQPKKSNPLKTYTTLLQLVGELDDLYEVVYPYFNKYFSSYHCSYTYTPFDRIRHPIMREKLIEAVSKGDVVYATEAIKRLKINLTRDEYHQLAGYLKSKRSEVRRCTSELLGGADEDTLLSCAKMLLQDKDEQRRNGALSILIDNIKKIESHAQFKEIQEILKSLVVSGDMEKSKNIILATNSQNEINTVNVSEEKVADFYSKDYKVIAPKIKVNEKILNNLLNIEEQRIEALIIRFQKILTNHNGETITVHTYRHTNESKVVGYDDDTLHISYINYNAKNAYEMYLFYEDYIAIINEFTNEEIINFAIIIDLINSLKSLNRYAHFRYGGHDRGRELILATQNAMRDGALPNMLTLIKKMESDKYTHAWDTFESVITLFIDYKQEEENIYLFKTSQYHQLVMNFILNIIAYENKENDNEPNFFSKLFGLKKPKPEAQPDKDSPAGRVSMLECLSDIVEKGFFVDSGDIPRKQKQMIPREDKLTLPNLDYNLAYAIVANAINIYQDNFPKCLLQAVFLLIENGRIEKDYIYQLIFKDSPDSDGKELQPLTHIAYQMSHCKLSIINKTKQEIYFASVSHMLETELERTELPTAYSKLLIKCHLFCGADTFLKATSKMGKMPFVRGYIYNGIGKKEMFSHIISNTMPDDDLTQATFANLAKQYNITDTKLLEAGIYNLRFIDFVETYLDIKGLAKAAYFFKAHMHDYFTEQEKTIFARYTDIDTSDLSNGQMDIKWFWDSYQELGEVNFEKLYNAAKYITAGAKHKRAQYFADAVSGKLELREVEARINDKRNQDMILAYGLIPFQEGKTEDALARYKKLQLFSKESKQFGAQRKQSEALKVSIAMNNLARNYGVRDTNRFTWIMETKLIESVLDLFTPRDIENIQVHLSMDKDATSKLVVIKDGKKIKSVPAKLNKHPYILQLKEVAKDLKEQYKRAKWTLENSMVYEDEFTLEELQELQNHPIISKLICDIVFISGEHMGMLKDGALVNCNKESQALTPKELLRIAHPADFLAKDWPQWQKYIMAEGIVQPFRQIFRELYTITEEEKVNNGFSNRFAGYQVAPKQMMGILKSRGWLINEYEGFEKINHKSNIRVDLYCYADWFTPSELESPTIERIEFIDNKTKKTTDMKTISPVFYSEIMRDVDLVVSVAYVGGVDPLLNHTTLEMRKRILEHNLELFKITNYKIVEKHIMIEGTLASYSLHLGSGIIHVKGTGMLPVFPVHSQHRGHIFLPFVDDDPKTSEIISKVLMLAKDSDIRDPNILMHLKK